MIGFAKPEAAGETQKNRPVEMVSWYDALVYCNKKSIAEGLTPVYSIKGSIYIRSLPNLELYNTIKLNPNKNLDLNNIYLQFYRNKNGNEQLYALDQSIQTLYIIGDSEN